MKFYAFSGFLRIKNFNRIPRKKEKQRSCFCFHPLCLVKCTCIWAVQCFGGWLKTRTVLVSPLSWWLMPGCHNRCKTLLVVFTRQYITGTHHGLTPALLFKCTSSSSLLEGSQILLKCNGKIIFHWLQTWQGPFSNPPDY